MVATAAAEPRKVRPFTTSAACREPRASSGASTSGTTKKAARKATYSSPLACWRRSPGSLRDDGVAGRGERGADQRQQCRGRHEQGQVQQVEGEQDRSGGHHGDPRQVGGDHQLPAVTVVCVRRDAEGGHERGRIAETLTTVTAVGSFVGDHAGQAVAAVYRPSPKREMPWPAKRSEKSRSFSSDMRPLSGPVGRLIH